MVVLWLRFSLLSSVSKQKVWLQRYHSCVCRCCRRSVNTICGRIITGFSLLSSASKHNMWWYYGWVCSCCRPPVSTICGCIIFGLTLLSVNKHNMWWYYGMVGLSLLSVVKHSMWWYYDWVCRCCHPLVSTICCRIMVGIVVVVSQ